VRPARCTSSRNVGLPDRSARRQGVGEAADHRLEFRPAAAATRVCRRRSLPVRPLSHETCSPASSTGEERRLFRAHQRAGASGKLRSELEGRRGPAERSSRRARSVRRQRQRRWGRSDACPRSPRAAAVRPVHELILPGDEVAIVTGGCREVDVIRSIRPSTTVLTPPRPGPSTTGPCR
jgi:hypothetical protein